MAVGPQKYHLQWPWNPTQVDYLDEMLDDLYRNLSSDIFTVDLSQLITGLDVGDILYINNSGVLDGLTIGPAPFALLSNGVIPEWSLVSFDTIIPATAASRLLGRGSAAGAGPFEEITLGVGLAMTGTVLSASGVGTGDVVGPASSIDSEIVLFDGVTGKLIKAALGTGVVHATSGVYSVSDVTLAEIVPASAASLLLGRGSAGGAGDWQEITIGSGLTMTNQVLAASGGAGTGDVIGPSSSLDGQIVLFDSTTGKLIKAATGTGVVKATDGVYGVGLVDLATETTGTLPVSSFTHDLLSASHPDTLPAGPVGGDLIYADGLGANLLTARLVTRLTENIIGIRPVYGRNYFEIPASGPFPQMMGIDGIPTMKGGSGRRLRAMNATIPSLLVDDFYGIRPSYISQSIIPASGPFPQMLGLQVDQVENPDVGLGASIWQRMPIGEEFQVLIVQGGTPQWSENLILAGSITAQNGTFDILNAGQTILDDVTVHEDIEIWGRLLLNPGGAGVPVEVSGANSGDVTLAGTPDYITLSGQVITRGLIDLTTDVTLRLPYANLTAATAASRLLGRGSAAGAGDFEEITLGSGVTLTGTVLSATGLGGDVVGPGSATDNAIVRFDGTTGKLVQNSLATVSDAGEIGAASALITGAIVAASGTITAGWSMGSAVISGLLNSTGGQIQFPATQVPSTDANTLDDYEEGTWTPVIIGTGGQSGQVYSLQNGFYVKIGRLVHVGCRVQLSTLGTITGVVQIGGFPFTSINATGYRSSVSVVWGNLNTAVFQIVGTMNENTTAFTLLSNVAAVTSINNQFLVQANLTNTTLFTFGLVYETDQ